MTGISFYCFLWRLISVRRVRASNGRQNRFLYRSHRNEQSRKNIVFMRLCGVSGILFSRRGEQIILLFFIFYNFKRIYLSRTYSLLFIRTLYQNFLTEKQKEEPGFSQILLKFIFCSLLFKQLQNRMRH